VPLHVFLKREARKRRESKKPCISFPLILKSCHEYGRSFRIKEITHYSLQIIKIQYLFYGKSQKTMQARYQKGDMPSVEVLK
jgi:hypothetical protein